MDPLIILAAKGAQALAGKAGERLGGRPAGDLSRLVAGKFKGDSYAQQTLARAQEKPDSKQRQAALQEVLAEKMQIDPAFSPTAQRCLPSISLKRRK